MTGVLVVDDAAFMRQYIKRILLSNGYEVVGEACNGNEGFQKYRELKPDLVTMDITMPDYTGIDGLKMIMQHDPQARIIMISAMGQESFVREAVTLGAKGFVVKPVKEDYLINTIVRVLSS